MASKNPTIKAPGHVLLSFFNIDYHESIESITEVLMSNPEEIFKLKLERVAPKKGKKNG